MIGATCIAVWTSCLLKPQEYQWQMTSDEVCAYVEGEVSSHQILPKFGEVVNKAASAKKMEDGLWYVVLVKYIGSDRFTIDCIFDEKTGSIDKPEMPNEFSLNP